MDATLFGPPPLPHETDWHEERLEYVVSPRSRSKFKTVLDAHQLFAGAAHSSVTTRTRRAAPGDLAYELDVQHRLARVTMHDMLACRDEGGLRPMSLDRRVHVDGDDLRTQRVEFGGTHLGLPEASYPEVLLPFLLRGTPRDRHLRATYAYTADTFIARVYYETRSIQMVTVPAGTFKTHEVWMYPDLNDWIGLGAMLARLAKPLLPRYSVWLDVELPHRVVRFEGAYGPPGAPEVVLELA